jgi:outer membrane lipoprotein
VEVLELPADPGEPPTTNRTRSEGRFLAVKEGMDPATMEPGHPVTVIGQVKGKAVKRLDETDYTYPVLEIEHLVDWEKVRPRYAGYGASPYPYGYASPYYGGLFGYYPYWYGPYYGPYGFPYWPFGFSTPAPPNPPPVQSRPPEFRKRNE